MEIRKIRLGYIKPESIILNYIDIVKTIKISNILFIKFDLFPVSVLPIWKPVN